MKNQIFTLVGMAVTFTTANLRAEIPAPLVINSIIANNGQVVLNWSGGRPNYQVQTAGNLSGNWVNIGAPTSAGATAIPMANSQAFFRVVSDFTAQYQVVFNATWSQAMLPTNWP